MFFQNIGYNFLGHVFLSDDVFVDILHILNYITKMLVLKNSEKSVSPNNSTLGIFY